MGIIGFIVLGIVAGYLGRLLMPGRQRMSFVATMLLGMLGSVIGGTLAALIFEGDLDLSTTGFLGSLIGVLIVLFLVERFGKSKSDRAVGKGAGRR